ncbi:MAG: hypothetical protein QF593_10180, partial [Nitrospinota bacterium]|nr:hypothetical protein [Nitrospinota bacterium]
PDESEKSDNFLSYSTRKVEASTGFIQRQAEIIGNFPPISLSRGPKRAAPISLKNCLNMVDL